MTESWKGTIQEGMAYSELYKKRALELGASRPVSEVLEALAREFPDVAPPGEATLRRWLAAGGQTGGKVATAPVSLKRHFAQLARINKVLLGDDVDKAIIIGEGHPDDVYGVVSKEFGYYEVTYRQLVAKIAANIEKARQSFGAEFDGFIAHLMAEYPPGEDYDELVKRKPGKLIKTLKEMAERKTFKGSCGVCR